MNIDLSGLVAVVTGSTAGIGYAIAKGLAGTGAEVVVNGRTQVRVDQALAALRKDVPGAKVRGVAADVGNAAGCAALAAAVPTCDILINNAGAFVPRPFEQITDADWMQTFELNVMSGVRLSRAYLAGMKAKNWGRIIFISSESAVQIPAEMIDYGMSKTAQISVARGIAESLVGTGITVNSVLPGPTQSEGVGAFLTDMAGQAGQPVDQFAADFVKTVRPSSLLQRFTTVDEVANMVVYVASKQASATTGAALRVDGGVVRAIL